MDDPVYRDFYHQEMGIAIDGCFNQAAVQAKINQYAALIRPYVQSETSQYSFLTNGMNEFDQAVTSLLNHIRDRQTTVRNYLNSY